MAHANDTDVPVDARDAHARPPWRDIFGSPGLVLRRLRSLARTFANYLVPSEPRRRIAALRASGAIDRAPNIWQVHVGTWRMLMDFKIPFAPAFYASRGKKPVAHLIVRLLDEPAAAFDPSGLFSPVESMISHTLTATHQDSTYDVEILETFPGGVDELHRQLKQVVAGTHPRRRVIEYIVEAEEYHTELLAGLERYREDPVANARLQPVKPHEGAEDLFARIEQFHTLRNFLRYSATLPPTPWATLRAWRAGTHKGRWPA